MTARPESPSPARHRAPRPAGADAQPGDRPPRLLVVGGGAAGFFGAIACARENPNARVVLLEAGRQFLSKVLISGGGRCNVTHACFDPADLVRAYPRGHKALRGAFARFQPRDAIAWFAAEGVALKTEADGRMFPVTDRSETVADCLIAAARRAGVVLRDRAAVAAVERCGGEFRVRLRSGETLAGDRLLLATGSSPQGHRFAAALGHPIAPPVPSLFTFNVRDRRLEGLAGLSADPVQLRLWPEAAPEPTTPAPDPGGDRNRRKKSRRSQRVSGGESPVLEQVGPLLVTHWGLSGPAVLKLSAWGARSLHESRYRATLQVNWLPDLSADALRSRLLDCKGDWGKRAVRGRSPVELPRRLWDRLAAAAGVAEGDRWAELSKAQLQALLQQLQAAEFAISGKGVFKDEFVTCGGVDLKSVDFKTLESRCCPGLHFAGEILDADGITGGFNFQNAWTTGWIAGRAIATGLTHPAPERNPK